MAPRLTRRSFLALTAGAAGAACSASSPPDPQPGPAAPGVAGSTGPLDLPPVPPIEGMPFALGVASGDPLPDRVVLWTRLAPRPLDGGGMPDRPAPVLWEVATDERFGDVVARGAHVAEPRWGHSVHVDATGLRPDSWYFYRFRVGDHVSPVGRTRTAPAADAANQRARFGVAACQNWTNGFYSAYPHLVEEDLDLMLWLGDYIYEGATTTGAVRQHDRGSAVTLSDYRDRYGLYNADPQLQAARAAMPWLVLWDDHEVVNNYGGDRPAPTALAPADPAAFAARKAAAYQAWWENQPVRIGPPAGPALRMHRTLEWGTLARFFALDERQYRSPAACAEASSGLGDCAERTAPGRTLLGDDQRAWFFSELDRTPATWNVIANEVIMSEVRLGSTYNLDMWDGYAAERRLVMERFASRSDLNPLVVTGDIHAFAVADLKTDYDRSDGPAVGTEIVGGSISSSFSQVDAVLDVVRALPHVHLADGRRRGYAVVDLDPRQAQARLRTVDTVEQPSAAVATLATVVVDAGHPGAQLA